MSVCSLTVFPWADAATSWTNMVTAAKYQLVFCTLMTEVLPFVYKKKCSYGNGYVDFIFPVFNCDHLKRFLIPPDICDTAQKQ